MSDVVVDLVCRVHDQTGQPDFRTWAYWMTNADVREAVDQVTVFQQSRFFCDQAARHLWMPLQA
jgi:hypothetical protein